MEVRFPPAGPSFEIDEGVESQVGAQLDARV